MLGRIKGYVIILHRRDSGTLWWMGTLAGVVRSYRYKLTLYLYQIKPHLITISELYGETPQKRLSVQVVRLSAKVCFLHFYTITLLSFSYISAKF